MQLSGYLNIPSESCIADNANQSILLYSPATEVENTVLSSVEEVSSEMECQELVFKDLKTEESQRKFAKNRVDFKNEEIVKCLLDLSVLEGNFMFSKVSSTLKSLPAFDYNWGAGNCSGSEFNMN